MNTYSIPLELAQARKQREDAWRKYNDLVDAGKQELANELLEKIRLNSWQFFEDLVVDLMVKMGYGGSRNKAGKSIKRTNDEGIDGIINEDKLGLDVIYLQAKKWDTETSIGRPEIQKFVGALQGQRAKKAFFLRQVLLRNQQLNMQKQ